MMHFLKHSSEAHGVFSEALGASGGKIMDEQVISPGTAILSCQIPFSYQYSTVSGMSL